jgi:hypothetical protein
MNVKSLALSALGILAVLAVSVAMASANPPSVTGTWNVMQSSLNGTTTHTLTLSQSGSGIVGHDATTDTGYEGKFVNDEQIDATWHGPAGAGWMTIYVTPNGHSFNGTWGYHGRSANGSFVGNKVLPPSPITAAGMWNVIGAGGATGFLGKMACTESGRAVVCHTGDVAIHGAFPESAPDKVRATWASPRGSGWFSFWFNGDNNSFNGVWGYGADTNPPAGRVVGQRALGE